TSTNITATMRGQTSTDNTQLSATIFPAFSSNESTLQTHDNIFA
ncbi:unnamed protein product, partial [Rotaria magnacalcarata]